MALTKVQKEGVETLINNNADNRVITGSGTANTLEGEANLTFDGTSLLTVHVPSATGEPALNFTNSDTGTGTGNGFGLGINGSESPYIWNRENTDLRIATNNTERVRITSAGRLDVKTGDLAVTGAEGGDAQLRLTADEGDDGADYWRLESKASDNNFNLATYASGAWVDKLSMNTDGHLMLGTSTKGAANGDDLTIAGSGHRGITIRSTDSSDCNIYFSDGTSGADEYRGYLAYVHSDNSFRIGANGSEKLRILSGGGLTFNGDTAAANALDDFEEGTWTATVYWSSSNTTGGYTNTTTVTGNYTKIGGVVAVTVSVNPSTMNSGSNCWISYISLPFQPSQSWGAAFAPYSGRGNYGGTLDRDDFNVPYAQFSSGNGGTIVPLVTGMGRGAGYWGHYSGDTPASATISGTYMTNS